MSAKALMKVRPDAKGRITLGALAKGISSYSIRKEADRIILIPNVEIPAREQWLWNNPSALKQVQKGLEDSAAGRVKSRGDFTQFIKDEE